MLVRLLVAAGLLAFAAPAPTAFATPDHALPCKMVNDPTTGKLRCADDNDLGGGDSDAAQKGNDTGDGGPPSTGPQTTGQACKAIYNRAVSRCDAMPGGTAQQIAARNRCLSNASAAYRNCLSRVH